MKVTRVIAVTIFLSSLALSALNAQTLRNSQLPAEFPPASFKGNQYVDSRGCIYIRAGIDGNVTWVPRVSRSRKQVCGYKPTAVTGTTLATPPKANRPPVVITVKPPAAQPAKPAATRPATPPAAPQVATRPKPVATPAPRRTTTVAPAPTRPAAAASPARTTPAQPATTVRKPKTTPTWTLFGTTKPATTTVRPAPTPSTGTVFVNPTPATPKPTTAPRAAPKIKVQENSCPGASAQSQRYINKPGGRFPVRCGPQTEPPVTYGRGEQQSSVQDLPPDTRVVPRHVYDNRQNTTNVSVPAGYKTVWDDDRLNPYRAERTLRPAEVKGIVTVPPGYRLVDWDDNRLNLRRGTRTVAGDAQSTQVWSNTVPRVLVEVPTQPRVVQTQGGNSLVQVSQNVVVTRLSSRSAPVAKTRAATVPVATTRATTTRAVGKKGRYVRVAIYAGDAEAQATAQALAGTGLPTRVGMIKSSGQRVVLAGPFTSNAQAKAALNQLRGAGYLQAKMSR